MRDNRHDEPGGLIVLGAATGLIALVILIVAAALMQFSLLWSNHQDSAQDFNREIRESIAP